MTESILTYPNNLNESDIKLHCVIDGEPISKQRPHFSFTKSGKAYTPKKTRDAEEYIQWAIKIKHRELICDDTSSFGVRVNFHQKSNQRRDVDNMVKLVFDACNKIVWGDDRQVIDLHARVFRNSPKPFTELCIFTMKSEVNERPTQVCLTCGKEFPTYPSWIKRGKVFCSRECQLVGTRNGINRVCSTCGKTIYRTPCRNNTKHFFCSNECKRAFGSNSVTCLNCNKTFTRAISSIKTSRQFCSVSCHISYNRTHPTKYHFGKCVICGAPTSKKKYKTCSACALALRKESAKVVDGCKQTVITIKEVKDA